MLIKKSQGKLNGHNDSEDSPIFVEKQEGVKTQKVASSSLFRVHGHVVSSS